jgi:KDO2-lipid IV(A) lauroyltransferase
MMKHRPKHVIEYVFLRALAAVFRVLPYRAALFIGWINAWLGFNVVRFRVNEARLRIRLVLGSSISDADVKRIAWRSWRNFVFTGVEMMRMDLLKREDMDRIIDGRELFTTLKTHTDTGKGAIAAVAHMGSWELSAIYAHSIGVPVFTLVGTQKNPLVDAFLNGLRQGPGSIEIIPRHGSTLRHIIGGLRAGKLLAIMPDVRVRKGGTQVPFLGGMANVGEGIAMFARKCEVPIIPCVVKRKGWSRHEAISGPFVWPNASVDKDDDANRMTAEVFAFFEQAIRKEPEQWFWYNKRWILDPVEPSS